MRSGICLAWWMSYPNSTISLPSAKRMEPSFHFLRIMFSAAADPISMARARTTSFDSREALYLPVMGSRSQKLEGGSALNGSPG